MTSNNSGMKVGYLAGRFPGMVGHLYSPGGQRGPYDFPGWEYALDNGAFKSYLDGSDWDWRAWIKLLEWAKSSGKPPLWALVPDVVANAQETIKRWHKWEPKVRGYGWPLAFAVQDGMTPKDVPLEADVVFVGGTRTWKWETVEMWGSSFPRTHVGRVNSYWGLVKCKESGVESTDGTGWVMGDQTQWGSLVRFMEEESGE